MKTNEDSQLVPLSAKIAAHNNSGHVLRKGEGNFDPSKGFTSLKRYERIDDPWVEKEGGEYELRPGVRTKQAGQIHQYMCASDWYYDEQTGSVFSKYRGTPSEVFDGKAFMCGSTGSGKNRRPITQEDVKWNLNSQKVVRIPTSERLEKQAKAWRKRNEPKIKKILGERDITNSLGEKVPFGQLHPFHFEQSDGLRSPPKPKPPLKTEEEIRANRERRKAETRKRNAKKKAEKLANRELKRHRKTKKSMGLDRILH